MPRLVRDLDTRLEPRRLCFALNDELPADIHVLEAERVSRRFHARHDAVLRSYLYQVSRRPTALGKPFEWWVKDDLDALAVREAAQGPRPPHRTALGALPGGRPLPRRAPEAFPRARPQPVKSMIRRDARAYRPTSEI